MQFNCSLELKKFHDQAIFLPAQRQADMREHRDCNQRRLKAGLAKLERPAPLEFVKQGSYAMRTMVQHPENDYDIDDGVVFAIEDLKGSQGADMSALEARKMVCEAVQDDRFKDQPTVKNNCVRIFYNEGYHVDVPVYRQIEQEQNGVTSLELGSSTGWKLTDPRGVTKWFINCLDMKEKMGAEREQLRRIVRYLKAFSRSRKSWVMPSGFILTVLCNDYYEASDRDDASLYETFKKIAAGITYNLVVNHPVLLGETITKTDCDKNMEDFRTNLNWALEQLAILGQDDCNKKSALKTWANVFNTSFFEDELKAAAESTFYISTGRKPSESVIPGGNKEFA